MGNGNQISMLQVLVLTYVSVKKHKVQISDEDAKHMESQKNTS